jgi:HlyD family secretion protein
VNKPRNSRTRRLVRPIAWGVGLVAVAVLAWAVLVPEPLRVETARAERGPLEVTVDQEGEVRAHDRYIVAAPIAGRLARVELHDGDPVRAGQVVARLAPAPLDPRERQEVVARLAAARALVREAQQNTQKVSAELAQAERERTRMDKLVTEGFVSPEAAEEARTVVATARATLAAARSREVAARSEAKVAEAALLAVPEGEGKPGRLMELSSPVDGQVLRVLEKSERTLPAGTPVMTVGDPARFEIVADVLSTDAVKIEAGDPARLEEWGGDRPLRARVRLVEPYAFTKVSALGIEEQRVNVVMDPVDPLGPLGDGYRVEARIVIWSADDVLKVPASALFRSGDGWAVFRVEKGRAITHEVEVGQRNALEAQIVNGLQAGEVVIRYPSNELRNGIRVRTG